jgi:hypothetical protein
MEDKATLSGRGWRDNRGIDSPAFPFRIGAALLCDKKKRPALPANIARGVASFF